MMLQHHTIARPSSLILLFAVCFATACAGDQKERAEDGASNTATAKSAAAADTSWQHVTRKPGSAQPGAGAQSETIDITASSGGPPPAIGTAAAAELAAFDDDAPAPPWNDPGGHQQSIPVCQGLTIVTAVASQGDYESIKTIESVTPSAYRLRYSNENGPPWWMVRERKLTQFVTHRTVHLADVESAHRYHHQFVSTKAATDTAPGSTAIGTSASVLRALKSDGEASLAMCEVTADGNMKSANGEMVPVPGGCLAFGEPFIIKRVGSGPVRVSVLVDGTPTELPAVRARRTKVAWGSDDGMEFLFLDDERNPLTLQFRLGIGAIASLPPHLRERCAAARRGERTVNLEEMSCDLPDGGDRDTLRVVKIDTRCQMQDLTGGASSGAGAGAAGGASAAGGAGAGVAAGAGTDRRAGAGSAAGAGGQSGGLERALAESGAVDVYSIYFSFNSEAIREESEPTLKEIADILQRRADWKLGITGHTDSVASDSYNLELSERRAAAVKQALVTRYAISGDRLQTAGRGEGSPKDTNDTLEGRARNRRVELVRLP